MTQPKRIWAVDDVPLASVAEYRSDRIAEQSLDLRVRPTGAPGGISSSMRALVDNDKLSFPQPNFSDAINRNVVQSEIEGGVNLYEVPPGTVIEGQTANHLYTIVHKAWGRVLISGHPEFCPDPVEVQIHGSTWGGSMIRNHYLGRGMHLEFGHPLHQIVITSRILDIREAA